MLGVNSDWQRFKALAGVPRHIGDWFTQEPIIGAFHFSLVRTEGQGPACDTHLFLSLALATTLHFLLTPASNE